ncbi:unnamed protein product [Coregonus sp. 'balchen']|nr:unnamed protein product [Coregonus sp. 'balchen']
MGIPHFFIWFVILSIRKKHNFASAGSLHGVKDGEWRRYRCFALDRSKSLWTEWRFHSGPQSCQQNELIVFEKAYCEYRLNRVESALKTIESVSEQTDKLKELYGQVLYRMERYDECKTVYTDLIRNSQDEYEEERKTNLSAVVAAMSTWEKASPDDLGLSETTYELSYNAACTLIGQGQLAEAMNKLQEAEELCRVSLSEDSDITEEDIESELAVIHSQMAYIMQLQGRTEEALQLYNQVIKLKPSDVGLLAVTANNIITINKDQNVFDSKKKVKLTNTDGVEYKLAKKQLQAIEFNKALLAMYTNQADQCRKLSSGLQSQNPGHPRPVLIQVAQLCREKQHSKAIELLQISALVTMYNHEEDIDSAIDVFSQAIQHYQSEQVLVNKHIIKKSMQNTNDIHTLAQLISAYSLVDQDKAKSLSKHLPSPESMLFNVDVDELENSHGANYVRKKAAKVPGDNLPKEQGQGDVKKKKKKKKKGKLPKNYDPTANPDQERWLPMRERTYYRGRKKGKKKEQVGKGTQGATSGAGSDLDASKTASSPPTSPRPGSAQASASTSAPAASNVVPPRQQKPATAGPGARKKAPQKKKKGGKSGW